MNKKDEFLKTQKIIRIATIDKNKTPHIVPVWYMYSRGKIYIGTNSTTNKVKNLKRNNRISFCVDVGINSPKIFGVMGQGTANLIFDTDKVQIIAKKILLRYFKTLKNSSAKELLDDTDCVIEIIPAKSSQWSY